MGNGHMPVPAAAAGFRARDVRDADAWHAPNRRTNRCDAVFHRVGRSDQARDVSTAAANPRGAALTVGRSDGQTVGRIYYRRLHRALPFLGLLARPTVRPADCETGTHTTDTHPIEHSNEFYQQHRAPD